MRRTSSLGRSQGSGLPVRVSSLGQRGETAADRGSQRQQKSFIPKPSIKRRSSSADRESRCQSGKTLRRSRSNLEMQLIGSTPATAQSCRSRSPFDFGSQSRKTGILGGAHHVKDPRPLGDKNYQAKEIEKVQEFLIGNKADTALIAAVAKKSLTLNYFVEIAYQMLSYFFPFVKLNMTNFVDEIPNLAKKVYYPGNIMKSNLKTANSSHSWPIVLGFLSWMAEILQYHQPEFVQAVLFPILEEADDPNMVSHRRKMEYYLKVFEYWYEEKSEEEALEDQKLAEEITNAIGIGDEEIEAFERERNELQITLGNEEHVQLLTDCTKLNEVCLNKDAKIHELEEAVAQKFSFKNEAPNRLAQMQKTIEVDKALNTNYRTKIDSLLKMLEEARNNNCVELLQESEQAISQYSTQLETYEKMACDSDIKLARLRRKLEALQTEASKKALAYSGSLPMLQSITQHGDLFFTERDLQEIEENLNNWKSELKPEISHLENVLEEKQENLRAREYQHKESNQWKALEAEMLAAEAEDLQVKRLEEQEEAKLKSELQDIVQENKALVKDPSVIEKAQRTLHEIEEKVKNAKLHNEEVHQMSQEIIDKRKKMFDDFMKKAMSKLEAAMHLQCK